MPQHGWLLCLYLCPWLPAWTSWSFLSGSVPRLYLRVESQGLQQEKAGQEEEGGKGGFLEVWGKIYMDHWTSGAFGDLEVAIMEDMSGEVEV